MPKGLICDRSFKNVYVCDQWNHVIRRINLQSNQVDTFAGTPGDEGK
jgi:hypothetical protein